MLDPMTMFREGGPFMYLLLLAAIAMPITFVVPAIVGGLKLRAPAALWFGLGQVPVCIGLLGSWMGLGMALSAAAYASPEMVTKLVANGISVALFTLVWGSALSAMAFVALALSIGLGAAIGVGGTRRITVLGAIPPVLIALMGAFGVFAGSWLGPLVAVLAAAALGLASIQASDEAPHNERLVAARGAVGLMGFLAILMVVIETSSFAAIELFFAQATATAEMKSRLMAQAFDGLWGRVLLLGATALTALLATAAACLPLARHLGTVRTLVSTLVAGLALTPTLLLLLMAGIRVSDAVALTADPGDAILASLQERGIELVEMTPDLRPPVTEGATLTFADDVRFDGTPVTAEQFEPPLSTGRVAVVWIQATPDTPLSTLLPYARKLTDVRVRWQARAGGQLRAFDLTPRTSAAVREELDPRDPFTKRPAYRLYAIHDGEDWTLARADDDAVRVLAEGEDLEGLVDANETLLASDLELHVWLPESATAEDLLDVGSLTVERSGRPDAQENGGSPDVWMVWRIDPPPSIDADPPPADVTGLTLHANEVANAEPASPASTPASPGASAAPGSIEVDGALDKRLIQAVVKRHMNQIRYCYQRELTKNPNIAGTMVVRATIAADGSVSSASTASSTLDSEAVESCIIGRFVRMKFPAPQGGTVELRYPLTFRP